MNIRKDNMLAIISFISITCDAIENMAHLIEDMDKSKQWDSHKLGKKLHEIALSIDGLKSNLDPYIR